MKTVLKTGASLLAVAIALGGAIHATPAQAQDAASIRSIQQQIRALEAQLKQLQAESQRRDADLKRAQDEAAQARAQAAEAQKAASLKPAQAAGAPVGTAVVTIPNYDPTKANGKISLGGVTVTLGGYVDLTGLYRSRNETRGTATSFTGIPFQNSADGHLSEFRGTAQQSRISLLVQGNADADNQLSAYGEMDFNNAAGGTNSVQSSSYTPRLRQAYFQWDNATYGAHIVGGQIWSLATSFRQGLTPRSELQPMTIDTAYLPGYAYLRVPELRITKDFDTPIGKTFVALAADDPQTVFGGTAVAPAGGTLVTGSGAGTTSAGNGGLNPATNYSYSVAPDLILKAATDTKLGHYEVFGLARWFRDRVEFANAPQNSTTHTTMGGGVGASAYVPLWKPYLEFSGNVLYGTGIGRYGSGGLPDVTYKADGSVTPLREIMGTVGLIGHPIPTVDIYTYYGLDQVESKTFTAGATTGGYGTGVGSNLGCDIEGSGLLAAPLACSGNNRRVSEITAGFWWRFYKGPYGTVQTGAQYGYVERKTFNTRGGEKVAPENLVYAGLRYTPFN